MRALLSCQCLGVQEFVVRYFDKSYEHLSLRELRDAPVSAIIGVSEAVAADLKQAFGIKTLGDFTANKYIRARVSLQ